MKWFQNPFSGHGVWRLKRAWWQIVAPGLIKENRKYAKLCDDHWDNWEKQEDEKEELEKELYNERYFWSRMDAGYWHIHIGDGVNSVARIDEKFIKWYETWVTPIQTEFQFEYERPETKEEEKKREKTYLERHDERWED